MEGLKAGLGPDHHFTLTTAMNLASDLAALGRPRDARRLGEDTLPRLTALLGATHLHTLGCAANLALDILETGDEDAGKALHDETLRLFVATYGDNFPDTVVAARRDRLDPDFDPPAI